MWWQPLQLKRNRRQYWCFLSNQFFIPPCKHGFDILIHLVRCQLQQDEEDMGKQMKESLLWWPHPSRAPMPRFSQFISSSLCWVMHCYYHFTNNYQVWVCTPEHPGQSNHLRWIHCTALLFGAQLIKISVSTFNDYYVIPLWRGALPPSYYESIEFDPIA